MYDTRVAFRQPERSVLFREIDSRDRMKKGPIAVFPTGKFCISVEVCLLERASGQLVRVTG